MADLAHRCHGDPRVDPGERIDRIATPEAAGPHDIGEDTTWPLVFARRKHERWQTPCACRTECNAVHKHQLDDMARSLKKLAQ